MNNVLGGLQGQALVYLLIAGICLMIALRNLRRVLAPLGAVLEVVAAATLVALAIGAALVMLTAAILTGR